jgi:hypothetical protein
MINKNAFILGVLTRLSIFGFVVYTIVITNTTVKEMNKTLKDIQTLQTECIKD